MLQKEYKLMTIGFWVFLFLPFFVTFSCNLGDFGVLNKEYLLRLVWLKIHICHSGNGQYWLGFIEPNLKNDRSTQ